MNSSSKMGTPSRSFFPGSELCNSYCSEPPFNLVRRGMSSKMLTNGSLVCHRGNKVLPKSWSGVRHFPPHLVIIPTYEEALFSGWNLWRRPTVILIMHNILVPASLIIIATLTCFILWFRCLLLSIALGCDLQEEDAGNEEATIHSGALATREENVATMLRGVKWVQVAWAH